MARRRHPAKPRSELKNISYEIFVGALSILSIVNLVLMYVFADEQSLQLIVTVMNGLFSVVFLGDFLYRILTAPSALRYFFRGFGWADLLASLPLPQVKILRLFRVWRVIRLFQQVGARAIWRSIAHDRAGSALMTLLFLGILILQFGSMGILVPEQHADGANIISASDALWYTIVTLSTVGYGDQFPVTVSGRLIGTLIIIVGVGIFGTFTGYLANLFLGPKAAEDDDAEDEPTSTDAAGPAATDTVHGLAAGAASGAVAAGAAAARPADTRPADTRAADTRAGTKRTGTRSAAGGGSGSAGGAAVPLASGDAARVAALVVQTEQALAEIRRILDRAS